MVLVADDHPVNREVIQRQLGLLGLPAALASDGLEALGAWRAQRHGVVLLDIHMPIMDGFSFIEACHKEHLCTDVPIVVISAVQEALQCMQEAPVHACIAKPFDLDDLIRTVGQYAQPNGARN